MKQRSNILFAAAGMFGFLAIALYGCGGGGGYGGGGTTPSMSTTSAVQVVDCSTVTQAVTVSATDDIFTDAAVHAPVGAVVKWTNNGSMLHSVTSGAPAGTPDGMFDQTLSPSQSVCLKFTAAGTYDYYCKFHYTLGMTGVVSVP